MSIILLWLLCIALAVAVLVALTTPRLQRFEHVGAEIAAGLLLASLPFIGVSFTVLPLALLAGFIQLWLLVLAARLIVGRLEQQFLLSSTKLNALLGLSGLIVLAAAQVWGVRGLAESVQTLLLVASLAVALAFLGQLLWGRRRFLLDNQLPSLSLKELPTVSVCIPARNEDHALADCLQRVLASDYPKLEVLVLDDCSQDNTSTIIRSFAHDGVRFVQGDNPAGGWLGKNQALQTLARQASGDYLLFIDVDTHVGPQSITRLMEYTRAHRISMLSVLPQNRLGMHSATFLGTLEQYWQLVLPITPRRRPVSDSCWLIAAESLRHLGGFASVSRKIVPQESFAQRLGARGTYRFLVSSQQCGITTAKRWSSQVESAVRLTYPRLHRQPMFACVSSLALGIIFVWPFVSLAFLPATDTQGLVVWLCAAACLVFVWNYSLVLKRTQPHNWLLPSFLWPVIALQEIVITIASMVQYEFAEVNWKGRNVCYPVLGSQRQAVATAWRRPSQTV